MKQYYENIEFQPAKRSRKGVVKATVIDADGYRLETEHLEHRDIYFKTLKNKKEYFGYYIIFLYDGGYLALFDLRGN